MFRVTSLLVVSCALLSTFAFPSICSPSSSSTSFVVAAPSNALFRDSTRLTDRLNQILLEINSVLDSEDQDEDEEEQEELADEQEIQQSAAEDPLQDVTEGDQIIGTINEAAAGAVHIKDVTEDDEKNPLIEKIPANDEKNSRSKKTGGLVRFGRGTRNLVLSPIKTSRQWYDRVKQYHSPEAGQLRREKKFDRMLSKETKRRYKYDRKLNEYVELRKSPDLPRWVRGVTDKMLRKSHSIEMKQRTRIDSAHAARRERLAARREKLAKKAGGSKVNPTPSEPES